MILCMSDYPRTLLEFQHLFPDDTACARHLERIRWPEGFECPSCGQVGDPWRFQARPHVLGGIRRACANRIGMLRTILDRIYTIIRMFLWDADLHPSRICRTNPRGIGFAVFSKEFNGVGRAGHIKVR